MTQVVFILKYKEKMEEYYIVQKQNFLLQEQTFLKLLRVELEEYFMQTKLMIKFTLSHPALSIQ